MEIHNFVRGLSPHPCAWTDIIINGTLYEGCKIYKVHPWPDGNANYKATDTPEAVIGHKAMFVQCADGKVEILEMQMPGKKRLQARDIINGLK